MGEATSSEHGLAAEAASCCTDACEGEGRARVRPFSGVRERAGLRERRVHAVRVGRGIEDDHQTRRGVWSGAGGGEKEASGREQEGPSLSS